jgi:phosphoserine phosphatase
MELKQQGLATWAAKWRACTPDQQAFLTAMQQRGYAIAIGSGWLDAAQQVCRYLGRDDLVRELS